MAESTFSDDDAGLAAQYRHLTAGQAGALAAGGGVDTLILTHFSSRYADVTPLAEQARARAGGAAVVAANDLDRIAFPKRRGRHPGETSAGEITTRSIRGRETDRSGLR